MDPRRCLHRSTKALVALAVVVVTLPVTVAGLASGPVAAATGDPGAITLRVRSARSVADGAGFVHKDDPVDHYKWMVNVDDTGDPGTAASPLLDKCLPGRAAGGSSDPDFADTCPWPSIRNTSGFAPIVAQGDETTLSGGTPLQGLPPGKYLISVTADGFKIDGQHFTVTSGATTPVTVRMNPTPLPLTTIRIQVFEDSVPVDATYEADAERGLAGFTAHLTDVFGEVSTDYYGNPLCTIYLHQDGDPAKPVLFDADNHPRVDESRSVGRCVSDRDGQIVIPNLGPNRYAAVVTPPAGQANQWVQTTTLEGARDHDIWMQEGETGFDNEVLKGGEQVPMVVFGFVRPRTLPVPATNPPTGEVKGVVEAGLPYIGGAPGLSYETGFPDTKVDGPIRRPWVALSDLGGGDQAVYVGRGKADGSFDIQHVPNGTYQLSIWDDNLDYILWSFNVEVRRGRVTDVGNKMIVGWFTHVHGHVFVDSNENGRRDPGERSVPNFTLTVRERDNSLMDQYTNTKTTNDAGAYDIRETYPLGKWLVLEAFNTRYRTTGITYRGENEKRWTTRLGGLVDVNFLPIIGLGGTIDWGVQPYDPGTNGGIAGTVSYDTTRNELDPADAVSEGYQPGIPGISMHLYASTACTATTPGAKANACRQGKQIVPLQVPDPEPGALLVGTQSTWQDTNADGTVDTGDTLAYTWKATNTGTVPLSGLTLSSSASTDVSCDVTALDPQVVGTCQGTHPVTDADVAAGLVRDEATASATHPDANGSTVTVTSAVSDDETATATGLVVLTHANLVDTDLDQRADAGEQVSYSFQVTNAGTSTLTRIAVTHSLPGKAPVCPVTALAPGEQTTCTASYDVTLDDVLNKQLADTSTATATLPDASVTTSPQSTDTLATDRMIVNPAQNRGAMVRGPELADPYVSETWAPPRGCTAYDYKGRVLSDQRALPEFGETANRMCVEAPMMGVATGPSDSTPGNAGQTVNGNYAFATSKLNLYPPGNPNNPAPNHDMPLYAPLPAGQEQDLRQGDYIVAAEIPDNPVGGGAMYQVTSEEDVNVFAGDGFLPQENMAAITPAEASDPPPPPDANPLPPTQPPSQQAGIISPCAGALHTVDVTADNNPTFLAGGGSPFQGQDRPSCQDKLVTVRTGQTTAPNFNLFTPVPLPTHFWGVTLNDLGLTFDKRSVNYGEAQGLPFVPVGLYDYAGRLMDTVHTDFNGLYEALEPSTDTYNCPVPAGPCPNMYRFVGNDPGQPGALNPDYNPRFRTIAASFQGWPGLYTVTDEAPTQVANVALAPDGTTANPTQCDLGATFPQLFAVDRPFVRMGDAGDDKVVTVRGAHFGDTAGTLTLGGSTVPTTTWSDSSITFTVPADTTPGAKALAITTASGRTGVNGITIQVVTGTGANSPANPRIVEVGPGKPYATVQDGLDAARPTPTGRYGLVVVWPNAQTGTNPRGEYTENVILAHRVHVQGVGPGGFAANGDYVPGSVLDGLGFNADNAQGQAWLDTLGALSYTGPSDVPDAAVVTVLNPRGGSEPSATGPNAFPPSIDGFTITGGVQLDFPTNINTITGGTSTPYGATGALTTQGGGVYVHDSVRFLQITDNVIRGNGGSYGGGVRVGTPYVESGNSDLLLARNQIRDNGGSNLAGGVGIFAGSDGYQVLDNAICGNFSAEYGGGLTAFGYQGSRGGTIRHNRIWFNGSYDEGGGVMVAGELPSRPTQLSPGTGPATIDRNVIAANSANDDGGGIRLLQVSGSHISKAQPGTIRITNNTVVNNVSAHEGGGIALDDAVFVDIVENTVAKNLTTATAVTSDGSPAPAGLSTATNSDPLQARLRSSAFPNSATLAATTNSSPNLLDDVFHDNRAGSYNGGRITGLGVMPDGTDGGIDLWDMGMTDVPLRLLAPVGSVLSTPRGTTVPLSSGTVVSSSPGLRDPFDLSVDVLASRTYPAFRQALVTAQVLPPDLMGDYHLTGADAVAYGLGLPSLRVFWGTGSTNYYTVAAPRTDVDSDSSTPFARPGPVSTTYPNGRWDAGSDQVQP